MLRQLLVVAAAAVLGAGPVSVRAQSSPSRPAPDQRVRINLVGGSATVEGRVVGWMADTLVLGGPILNGAPLDTSMRIPRASIASYQLGLGRDHGRGFARGVKAGALVGGSIGLALLITGALMDNECTDFCIPPVAVGAVLGVGTTLGGVLLGGMFGTIAAPQIWGEPQEVAAAGGPRSRRARLGVTLSLARR
jgi:hypothetical protein